MPATTLPGQILPVSMSRYAVDFEGFSRDLVNSFERFGFAIVADHGLDERLLARATHRTKAFFALPEAVKRAYHQPGAGGARGYTPFGVETAKGATAHDLKEFWHVGRDLPEGHPHRSIMRDNIWPSEVEGFRPALVDLYAALDELGRRILEAIAVRLSLSRHWFDDRVRLGNSVLRLLHYPPVPVDAEGVRAGAHEDINVITLLLGAEEAGLEILARDEEGGSRWLPVNPPPGAVVCNIGDMLQRLTNRVLPSTTHRVVNPPVERRGVARYSTPFFLHFEPGVIIAPLPQCVGPGRPVHEPEPIEAQAFLEQRLREIKLA